MPPVPISVAALLALVLVPLGAAGPEGGPGGGDRQGEAGQLQDAADRYVDEARRTRGLAVALVTPDGVEVAVSGRAGGLNAGAPSASTLFEIGSITKVFTGVLLADLADHGIVSTGTTLRELMPGDRTLDPRVADVTLLELATHTSGLPRLPENGAMLRRVMARPSNPYAGAAVDELFDAVAALDADDVEGRRGRPEYSNLGVALLGRLLEEAAGQPYEELLEERVLTPMGLDATRFTRGLLDHPERARGHRENLRPTPSWLLDAYNPAGGLTSNLDDLVRFVQAAMTADTGPLAGSLKVAWAAEDDSRRAGLGWAMGGVDGDLLIWHNGRTGGYYAFVGFLPERERGVVVLSNASHSGDPFAVSLLKGDPEITRAPVSWLWAGFTLLFVALGPISLYRLRGRLVAGPEERRPFPRGRIHLVSGVADATFLLAVIWKLGVWDVIPGWYWWLGLAGAVGLAVAAVPATARLPWWPPGRPWRAAGTVTWTAVVLVLATWVIFRL